MFERLRGFLDTKFAKKSAGQYHRKNVMLRSLQLANFRGERQNKLNRFDPVFLRKRARGYAKNHSEDGRHCQQPPSRREIRCPPRLPRLGANGYGATLNGCRSTSISRVVGELPVDVIGKCWSYGEKKWPRFLGPLA